MKVKTLALIMLVIAALCMSGCEFNARITLEEEYDVRIVNRSGQNAKIRWDGGSYRYLDDDCIISIPVDGGHYELEWADASPRSHTRPKKIFQIEVSADIDIVFREEPDVNVIVIDG